MGSLVAALASYLDAKVHRGRWLVRIEDIDETRSVPGAAEQILHTLQQLGMQWDGEVVWQSRRKHLYQAAYSQLAGNELAGQVYACTCSRREIADSALRLGLGLAADGAVIYPGTCRPPNPCRPRHTASPEDESGDGRNSGSGTAPPGKRHALRLRVPEPGQPIHFIDRRLGPLSQDLGAEVGDFVLQRPDGFWSYQMAGVVDDAAQQVTHVVRGEDLIDSTARQIYLQRLLQLPEPQWLHVPVVRNADGEKLSKQTGATALDLSQPLRTLQTAAGLLGLPLDSCDTPARFWASAPGAWQQRLQEWARAWQPPRDCGPG